QGGWRICLSSRPVLIPGEKDDGGARSGADIGPLSGEEQDAYHKSSPLATHAHPADVLQWAAAATGETLAPGHGSLSWWSSKAPRLCLSPVPDAPACPQRTPRGIQTLGRWPREYDGFGDPRL